MYPGLSELEGVTLSLGVGLCKGKRPSPRSRSHLPLTLKTEKTIIIESKGDLLVERGQSGNTKLTLFKVRITVVPT